MLLENRCRDYANLLLEVLAAMGPNITSPLATTTTSSIPFLEPQFYRLRERLVQRRDELLQLLRDLNNKDDHRDKLKFLNFVPIGDSKEFNVAKSPRKIFIFLRKSSFEFHYKVFGSFDGKAIGDYAKDLAIRDKEIEQLREENEEMRDRLRNLNSKFQNLELERLALLQQVF